ncbi:hypothetical protein [Paracoccus thiocyanatus]|uniref:Uncharacterized protein n=1 Tax=Paracoccus thiocyanatus TaxID=34006 RepID=A0A3D8PFB3_9RHOB|nr:hypothetical protein [Paracoccus thiocyanatus]RDW14753.1 hypothetical protein DIE28_01050 [Paracoccus thiocyanatus]
MRATAGWGLRRHPVQLAPQLMPARRAIKRVHIVIGIAAQEFQPGPFGIGAPLRFKTIRTLRLTDAQRRDLVAARLAAGIASQCEMIAILHFGDDAHAFLMREVVPCVKDGHFDDGKVRLGQLQPRVFTRGIGHGVILSRMGCYGKRTGGLGGAAAFRMARARARHDQRVHSGWGRFGAGSAGDRRPVVETILQVQISFGRDHLEIADLFQPDLGAAQHRANTPYDGIVASQSPAFAASGQVGDRGIVFGGLLAMQGRSAGSGWQLLEADDGLLADLESDGVGALPTRAVNALAVEGGLLLASHRSPVSRAARPPRRLFAA